MNNYGLFYSPLFVPFIPAMNEKPPTVYALLESIVNFGKDDKTKIKDLASQGRTTFFDFDYPLTENITKEQFETMILNRFLMRRIGFDTLTAFKIQLNVKLNSIMPLYNKMFDALENWSIFSDGERETKQGTDNRTTSNSASNNLTNTSNTANNSTSDRRKADLPQDQLENLQNGTYVSDYEEYTDTATSQDTSTSQGSSTSNGTDNNTYNETITRSPSDKITIMKEMQENINSIYEMIFKDLECLFYQLV